jgi:CHAD domain-containing protein
MTPLHLFRREIQTIRTNQAGVFDGERGSIHIARIATRRLRELLPLTYQWQRRQHAEELGTMVKRMGRSLGRVRDADVRIDLLRYLEARTPAAASSLVLARHRDERERLTAMRKLVKRFERLGVDRELARLCGGPWRTTSAWAARSGAWRELLRRRIEKRSHAAADAVTDATGVYFPKRAHAARIALKKLRYAVEIAVDTSMVGDAELPRTLKKSQDVLGDLHDRQALIDELRQADESELQIDANHIQLVEQFLIAEINDLHVRFLRRRAEIHEVCNTIGASVRRSRLMRPAAAVAGVVAIVTGLEARRRIRRRRTDGDSATLAVRVAVPLPDPAIK